MSQFIFTAPTPILRVTENKKTDGEKELIYLNTKRPAHNQAGLFSSCQSSCLRVSLLAGVVKSRWASRSSTSVTGRVASRGGFDSHALPPKEIKRET